MMPVLFGTIQTLGYNGQSTTIASCFPRKIKGYLAFVIYRTFLIIRMNAETQIEIGSIDSADFADFEEVIGGRAYDLFVAKLQGVDSRNLFYLV
jgi:hypothetical protein